MTRGLVFGKFLPLHQGHIALVEFAQKHCDLVQVVLCASANEPIDAGTRKQWLLEAFNHNPKIEVISFCYDENELPNSSVSSREISAAWAKAFTKLVPSTNIVFTSEPYGEYVAEYMSIEHKSFNQHRDIVTISASQIRDDPFRYWEFIPQHVRYWFVKKIAIVGTESTGKSILTERLAHAFDTVYVPEMARDIVSHTESCTYEDLKAIAGLQARTINETIKSANKLLVVDTDLLITKSYALFLFQKELVVDRWIEEANRFDLYLFLEPDCEYVQDGTRLTEKERAKLSDHHRMIFNRASVPIVSVSGNWQERFQKAHQLIRETFLK